MRTFTDSAGRLWTLSLNIGTAKRIKGIADVDIMGFVEGDLLEKVIRNPMVLAEVIYALCSEQAESLKITPEEFGKALGGPAIAAARDGFLEEVADFFQEEGPTIRRQAQKLLAAYRKLLAAVNLKIDGIDTETLATAAMLEAQKQIAPPQASGDSSGSLPVSRASAPIP